MPERDVHSDELFTDAGLYADRLAQRDQWHEEARTRLQWARTVIPAGGSLLEIGAATGEFVAAAEAAGFIASGLELSGWAVAGSRELTGNVHQCDLTAWLEANPEVRYDAVVLMHVLEHIPDPRTFLADVMRCLRSGGVLVIEVPNGGSRAARTDGGRAWWMAALEDHFFHYTEQGIWSLLTASGFSGITTQTLTAEVYTGHAHGLKNLLRSRRLRANLDLLRVTARA